MNRIYCLFYKWHLVILAMYIILNYSSCFYGETYQPPQLDHTYTTDTERDYSKTGLRIKIQKISWEYERNLGSDTISSIDLKIYLEGRLLTKFNIKKNQDTFIAIPPGKHRLDFDLGYKSFGIFGERIIKASYEFELGRGDTGIVDIGYSEEPYQKHVAGGGYYYPTHLDIKFTNCTGVREISYWHKK